MSKLLDNKYIAPLLLLFLGLSTRFAYIWHPREVVFDEVHFGKYVSGYLTGEYFFDIHPPLGKLFIALAALIGGFQPGFDFKVIGEEYTSASYIALRFVPNLFGGLLPVCIFYFTRSLRGSVLASFFAGSAIVLENSLLVQSHFIFVDSMLLFFGFLGLALFFWYRNHSNNRIHLLAAGISLALSFSVKWTGISFLGLAGLVSIWDLGRKLMAKNYPVKEIIIRAGALIVIPFVVYVSIYAVHFSLLHKSGPGDAYMSKRFLKTIEGSSVAGDDSIRPLSFYEKFIELNRTMYSSNAGLSAKHPYSSQFYTWPLMLRPIYYWGEGNSSGFMSRIFLLGNPFIWWTAFGALIAGLVLWKPGSSETKWFLYLGWYFSFSPFFYIKRVMFLYHYFPPLIFSIVIMALFFFDGFQPSRRIRTILFLALLVLFMIGFVFFSPLSYGFPLSSEQYDLRVWLKKWR